MYPDRVPLLPLLGMYSGTVGNVLSYISVLHVLLQHCNQRAGVKHKMGLSLKHRGILNDGCLVMSVKRDSIAAKAGIVEGDVIIVRVHCVCDARKRVN